MNKKIFILLVTCILIALGIFIVINYYDDSNEIIEELEVRHGDKFTLIDEYNNKYILDYRQADLNNDSIVDDILLIGDKEKVSDNFANNMLVVVRDCKTGRMKEYILEGLEGYRAHIEISNLLNKDIPQILFSTDSGQKNKEKQFIILNYENGKFKEIFGLENNKGIELEGAFLEKYIVKINIKNLNKDINIDLKDKADFYCKNNIYNSSGNLLNTSVCVKTKNIDSIDTYTFEDNTKGIITTQKLIGINKTDILDDIKTIWKLDKNKLTIISIEGQRCGKLL